MRKNLLVILFTAIVLSISVPPAFSADQVKLAIIPFKVDSTEDLGYVQDGILDMLSSRIAAKGNVLVLEKTRVRRALEEWDAEITEPNARELGIKLEVDFIVFGSITGTEDEINIDVKMLDIRKEEVIVSTLSSTDLDGVMPKIIELAANINRATVGEPVAVAYAPTPLPPSPAVLPEPEPKEYIEEEEVERWIG